MVTIVRFSRRKEQVSLSQKKEPYIAHRRQEDGKEQGLLDHLRNTARLAYSFADGFGAGQLASDIALAHDAGKYSRKFQRYIRGEKLKVDHSSPGGQLIIEQQQKKLGMIAAYCIMGHHGGLPNGGSMEDSQDDSSLHGRLKKVVEDCSAYTKELSLPSLEPPEVTIFDGFNVAFLIRMLFSSVSLTHPLPLLCVFST